jgi:hypothetical protein
MQQKLRFFLKKNRLNTFLSRRGPATTAFWIWLFPQFHQFDQACTAALSLHCSLQFPLDGKLRDLPLPGCYFAADRMRQHRHKLYGN